MNITLSVNEDLVKRVRKIAVDRDTTLTSMVRDYLLSVVDEDAASAKRQQEREALERTFREVEIRVSERTWTSQDLYDRA